MGRTPAGETRDRIFRFVRERLLAGRPPTTREVQEAFKYLRDGPLGKVVIGPVGV